MKEPATLHADAGYQNSSRVIQCEGCVVGLAGLAQLVLSARP